MPKVQIYGSSVSGNIQVKKYQQHIESILKGKQIEYEFLDIAADEDAKDYMRSKNHGKTGLPQIFVDGEFVGLYEDFEFAVEDGKLSEFLKQ